MPSDYGEMFVIDESHVGTATWKDSYVRTLQAENENLKKSLDLVDESLGFEGEVNDIMRQFRIIGLNTEVKYARQTPDKKKVEIPVKYIDKDEQLHTVPVEVEAEWDETIQDWILDGEAMRKLDEVKARHIFDECEDCKGCKVDDCLLNDDDKLWRWGIRAIENMKLDGLIEQMREQCFHMTDEEASVVVDEFVERHPELLTKYTKEELIKKV